MPILGLARRDGQPHDWLTMQHLVWRGGNECTAPAGECPNVATGVHYQFESRWKWAKNAGLDCRPVTSHAGQTLGAATAVKPDCGGTVWYAASMNSTIDVRALGDIDREVDVLVRDGHWTKERFAEIWPRALVASGDNDTLLEFLLLFADADWLPTDSNHQGNEFWRVPRRVAEVIGWIQDGWEPQFALPPIDSVVWDDLPLPCEDASLAFGDEDVCIRGTCGDGASDRIRAEIRGEPGRLIRQSMRTTHRGGWAVDIANVGLRKTSYHEGRETFEFRGSIWRARRGQNPPDLWVARILSPINVGLGNLLLCRTFIHGSPLDEVSSSSGWGHLRVSAAYDYYIIDVKQKEQKNWFLVVDTRGAEIDPQAMHSDLAAVELVLGRWLRFSHFHGLLGPETVASGQLIRVRPHESSHSEPAVFLRSSLHRDEWIALFIELVSSRLRAEKSLKLWVPIEAYLSALEGTIDEQARKLYDGILALSNWIVLDAPAESGALVEDARWRQWTLDQRTQIEQLADDPTKAAALLANLTTAAERNPWQVFDVALHQLGIDLPPSIRAFHAEQWRRLSRFGMFTDEPGRDPVELRRELEAIRELRSILIAMVAAMVGYHGPIRGTDYEGREPSWWTVKEASEDRLPRFAAAMAPELIAPPPLGATDIAIIVQDENTAILTRHLLFAARLPVERVHFEVLRGRKAWERLIPELEGPRYAVLAAAKTRSVPDAVAQLRSEFKVKDDTQVFCSIPGTEGWALADDELLRHLTAGNASLTALVDALPLPEEVVNPLEMVYRLLGAPEDWIKLRKANIYQASARSPSLRHFVSGVAAMLGVPIELPKESVARALDRDAIAGLIREIMSGSTIAWKTSNDRSFTAEEISREIQEGTEAGRQYAEELVRISIDMLRRQARPRKTS